MKCNESHGKSHELEGTRWILAAYAAGCGLKEALSGPSVDANFADGKVTGRGGVNRYHGGYELDGDKLTLSPVASTMMAGPPDAMEQEAAYFRALGSAASYSIEGDTLTLSDTGGESLLEFRAAEE